MHISIVWHDRSFNINLHSSEGKDAFLELKGCRIQQSQKGEFVSMPSTKNAATGKYWNHAYINSAFQVKVLELAKASQPAIETKKELKTFADIDDDIAF
jgi:DNA-binding cell septation regulator SpoVG